MKTKLLTGFALIVMAITVCSCATSRKYGCPPVSKAPVEKKNFNS